MPRVGEGRCRECNGNHCQQCADEFAAKMDAISEAMLCGDGDHNDLVFDEFEFPKYNKGE